MTIICYRDGVIAADNAVFLGNIRVGSFRKIASRDDGALAAAAGTTSICERFNVWFVNGCQSPFDPKDEDKDFSAIIVHPDGHVQRMGYQGDEFSIEASFYAIGFPQDFALGAMAAGATAEEAVRLCLQWHDGCGGDIQVERLK